MAKSNHGRIGDALELLNEGLRPFVERELKANYGANTPYIPDNFVNDTTLAGMTAGITAMLASSPDKTAQLFNVTHVAYNTSDPSTLLASALQVQWYNLFATDDAFTRLGGNPYNNKNPYKLYLGSKNDLLLNLKVQRYAADPRTAAVIQNNLQTTGLLHKPLVTMHTLADPVVPYWHEVLYTAKVLQTGSAAERVSIPIAAYGHCAFTPAQVLVAFGIMVLKASAQTFSTASVQAALPDPKAQQEYQTLRDQVLNGTLKTPGPIYLPVIQN